MSLTAVAKATGLSLAHVSRIVGGSRRPSPAVAKKLADATGLPREAWLYPDEHGDIVQALYSSGRVLAPAAPAAKAEDALLPPLKVVGK